MSPDTIAAIAAYDKALRDVERCMVILDVIDRMLRRLDH